MLYYLSGYLFTVLGAFTVICLVVRVHRLVKTSARWLACTAARPCWQ